MHNAKGKTGMRTYGLLLALLASACGANTNSQNDLPPGSGTLRISEVEPATGPLDGGIEVVIRGNGFKETTRSLLVTFAGSPAEVLSYTNNEITALIPPQEAEGDVDIVVTNALGTTQLKEGFKYQLGEGRFGSLLLMWQYDFINPNQFIPNESDFIDAYASFVKPTQQPLVAAVQALNSCEFNPTSSESDNFEYLDAGPQVSLSSGSAYIPLPKQEGPEYYPSDSDPILTNMGSFKPESMYSLEVSGGVGAAGLSGFTVDSALKTPANFQLTTPDIGYFQGSSYTQIDTLENTTFSWTGGTPGDAFYIQIIGLDGDTGARTNEVLVCRPQDDGSFSIPARDLSRLAYANMALVYVGRRQTQEFKLEANASTGQSMSLIYKIGVVELLH